MDGVPKHMAYYKGSTGKNRRSKLMERLKREVPDKQQREAVMSILKEYAILYHIQYTKE